MNLQKSEKITTTRSCCIHTEISHFSLIYLNRKRVFMNDNNTTIYMSIYVIYILY